jgi:hypothetical protein
VRAGERFGSLVEGKGHLLLGEVEAILGNVVAGHS